jgi:hypothetical protein
MECSICKELDVNLIDIKTVILISNFRLVLNVVLFLLNNSPASEFYAIFEPNLCL